MRAPLQLLREWPPGYGGVERVCHELASAWNGSVYSLDVGSKARCGDDPLGVPYERQRLPAVSAIGRLHLPRPSWPLWSVLSSARPLHGHLPSPGVLLVLLLARIMRPRRLITVHWHCFLATRHQTPISLQIVYQRLALFALRALSGVVTTSPFLASSLEQCGCPAQRIAVLPCCLSEDFERQALALPPSPLLEEGSPLQALYIGRLDSYKRLDWLLEALATLASPWCLSVVGDGPKRDAWETLSSQYVGSNGSVHFHGRLSEEDKLQQLAAADVLVLPSDRSNEGFGIVQLEAMAAGIPALAFDLPRSGMGWVCQLPSLTWPQTPEALPSVLQRLADDPQLLVQLGMEARQRYLELFSRRVWRERLALVSQAYERNDPQLSF